MRRGKSTRDPSLGTITSLLNGPTMGSPASMLSWVSYRTIQASSCSWVSSGFSTIVHGSEANACSRRARAASRASFNVSISDS